MSRSKAMKLDPYVPVLDLVAFFLITPEILGSGRIDALNRFLRHPIVTTPYYALKLMTAKVFGFDLSDEDSNKINSLGAVVAFSILVISVFLCLYFFHSGISRVVNNLLGHAGSWVEILATYLIGAILPPLITVAIYMTLRAAGFLRATLLRRNVIVIFAILLFISARLIEIDTRWDLHYFKGA